MKQKRPLGWRSQVLSSSGWQSSGPGDSKNGGKIRGIGTRNLREDWVADFGGFVGNFGLVVGFFGWELFRAGFCLLGTFGDPTVLDAVKGDKRPTGISQWRRKCEPDCPDNTIF